MNRNRVSQNRINEWIFTGIISAAGGLFGLLTLTAVLATGTWPPWPLWICIGLMLFMGYIGVRQARRYLTDQPMTGKRRRGEWWKAGLEEKK